MFYRIHHEGEWFLRDKTYNMSYRLIICYSILYYLEQFDDFHYPDVQNIKSILCNLHNSIDECSVFYDEEYPEWFLHAYPFYICQWPEEGIIIQGMIVIDKSKGCYPLLLYPDDLSDQVKE